MGKASPKMERDGMQVKATEPLSGVSEAWLLKLFALHFERQRPHLTGKQTIADLIGKTTRHVDDAMNGITCISIESWFKLEFASQTTYFSDWLAANFPVKNCSKCPITHKKG